MASARHVLIPTHVNTDGDGISSALAMAEIVRVANPAAKVTTCIPDGRLPPTLDLIPGVRRWRAMSASRCPSMMWT